MRLRSHKLSILLITLLLSMGFGVTYDAEAADFEIVVKPGTKEFTPHEIKIKVGDRVTWTNKSGEEHFLTSAGHSGIKVLPGTEFLMIHKLLHPGESHTHTFSEHPETYPYFCAIHMQMWGTVTVEK